MLPRVTIALALCCGVAFGQATANSNSVTVTAYRTTNVAPDEVVFSVEVNTPPGDTLDDAVNALQGSGITSANFSQVSSVQIYDPATSSASAQSLAWYFSLTTPLSGLKATIGLLSAVQQSNGAKNNGISISFSVSGTAVSAQAQQAQQCAQTDLLSDAKAQAQKLAAAAGKGLGAVLAMSGSTTTVTQSSGVVSSAVSTPGCTLTVKFQLTGM
jgi:uncharacterized protein YggE